MLFLFSCSNNTLKKPSQNKTTHSKNLWGDWSIFPIKNTIGQQTTVRNDLLMYRIRFKGFNETKNLYRYDIQFKNTRNKSVRILYNMFSQYEQCSDLQIYLGPNKESKTIAHLFEINSPFFIELKDYDIVTPSEELIGQVIQSQ